MSQLCVGGYSLAAVTLAGTLARAPALVLATHWYLPKVRLDKEGMNRLLGPSTAPKPLSNNSWPFRRQLMLTEAGRALQRRFTLPPSFCTTDMGSSVNTGTSSKESSQTVTQTYWDTDYMSNNVASRVCFGISFGAFSDFFFFFRLSIWSTKISEMVQEHKVT